MVLGKYYIYCRKCHNSVPSIRGFIARARCVFNIELHIAKEKNKLFRFQKWEKLTNALNSSWEKNKLFRFQKWEKLTNALNSSWRTVVPKNATLFLSRHLCCCCIYICLHKRESSTNKNFIQTQRVSASTFIRGLYIGFINPLMISYYDVIKKCSLLD